jgi:hypothetical protein
MNETGYLNTGQINCYDSQGRLIECRGSGQDGELRTGIAWPEPRFSDDARTVLDRLTGLVWLKEANIAEFPLSWSESLEFVQALNRRKHLDREDWRLPNRRELRSLISYQTRNPALPERHPFMRVFIGWYWTSTTSAVNPAYAWYVHMEGGRMFYGRKSQYYLTWPVAGPGSSILPATGQKQCFDGEGHVISPRGEGQDGELRLGVAWPSSRFVLRGELVVDRLTNLVWTRTAGFESEAVSWERALNGVLALNRACWGGIDNWRLPTINELESLVDAGQSEPALPEKHPFDNVREAYWSSTSSSFEPDWCMALYMWKGAVGVGQKRGSHFHAWPVSVNRFA